MKKICRIFICFILMSVLFAIPVSVSADTGPKPSVIVNFKGVHNEPYYATLLSSEERYGPWHIGNDYQDYYGDEAVFRKFSEYTDTDGYHYLGFMDECTSDHRLSWTYMPPSKFKILLYFPERDTFFVTGDIYERYAFDSYFTANVNPDSNTLLIARKSYDHGTEILGLIARVILTIAVEMLVALLFCYRGKKSLKIIGITNICTQILLNLMLNIIGFFNGPRTFILSYILFEIIVFAVEAAIYKRRLPKDGRGRFPRLYAAAANAASFIVGIGIAQILPAMF